MESIGQNPNLPNNPESKTDTELSFVYSVDSEVARVNYTIGKKDWYDKNYPDRTKFKLPLPEGSSMDGLSVDYVEVIESELEPERAAEIEASIRIDFEKNYTTISNYFEEYGFDMPKSFTIRLTKYGTGGSYTINPAGMTINIRNTSRAYLGVLIHELTHTAIEERVLEVGLNQKEKESIVDYLMIENEEIYKLTGRNYQFGKPTKELLKRVGLKKIETPKPSRTEISKEITTEVLTENYNKEVAHFFNLDEIEGIETITFDSKEAIIDFYNKTVPKKYGSAPDYLVAFSPGNKVYIIHKDNMPTDVEDNGRIRFNKVLKHEIVHKYIKRLKGNPSSWLEEGICCFVAEQDKYDINKEEITLELLKELSNTQDGRKYGIGWNMVKFIVEEYGKEKLFELVKMNEEDRLTELQRMFEWLK